MNHQPTDSDNVYNIGGSGNFIGIWVGFIIPFGDPICNGLARGLCTIVLRQYDFMRSGVCIQICRGSLIHFGFVFLLYYCDQLNVLDLRQVYGLLETVGLFG